MLNDIKHTIISVAAIIVITPAALTLTASVAAAGMGY